MEWQLDRELNFHSFPIYNTRQLRIILTFYLEAGASQGYTRSEEMVKTAWMYHIF